MELLVGFESPDRCPSSIEVEKVLRKFLGEIDMISVFESSCLTCNLKI